jgi:hypothetical protein
MEIEFSLAVWKGFFIGFLVSDTQEVILHVLLFGEMGLTSTSDLCKITSEQLV